jgi:hypothetical protein
MWHEDEEVQQAAEDDCGGLFEEAGKHQKTVSGFGSQDSIRSKPTTDPKN